jgi:hypothetical protein
MGQQETHPAINLDIQPSYKMPDPSAYQGLHGTGGAPSTEILSFPSTAPANKGSSHGLGLGVKLIVQPSEGTATLHAVAGRHDVAETVQRVVQFLKDPGPK